MLFSTIKCSRLANYVRYYSQQSSVMKFLNVAEKNDAAKTIAGLLSNGAAHRREGYSVYNKIYDFEAPVRGRNAKMVMTSVSGHLMGLEFLVTYRNWRNVDPRSLFDAPIRKTVSENFEPIKRTLEREVRGCQGLIIWTDCDREGENIGFEIINVCRAVKPNLTVYRASFSEITTAAVRRALQQLGEPDKRQSDAVDVRSELDLRTGAAITRFQTLRLQRLFPEKIADKLISYGSCQIPTLGFVAERYKEIEAFVSEAFWKIKVTHTIDDLTVEFNWARNRLFDKEACENYLLLCLAEPEPRATVENVTVKPKHKWRPTPLDTVEMEKLGSRKLKLSAKETMTIAEKLYSKGFISYPRTETNQFSKEFELAPLVEQQTGHGAWGAFAQRVLEWGPNPRNGSKSDQAHPPIHPIKLVTNLEGNEARVYELVVRHFLACVSKDAVGSETIVSIDIAGEKFNANGLVIHERNYLDVYVYDKWSAKQIHNYEQGQRFEPTEILLHEGATTAPPLLTEADLIALMEKHGIGTDATHAEHINTIKERGYIGVADKGALVPGVIGMGLYEGYDAMELALAKPMLRAEFEADLKRICLGEKDPKVVLTEQIAKYKQAYQQITNRITAMDAKISQRLEETPAPTSAADNPEQANVMVRELFPCPKCDQAPLALKPKKNQTSFFIGCLNFPDCKNVVWLPDECKEYSVLDECCPTCGDGYRMLKFRLSSAYYRGLFNAPHGWYKNCLRCDELFRSTFNINLDQVKRVGGIVGPAAGSGRGPGPGPGPGGGGGGNSGGGGGPPRGGGGGGSGGGGPSNPWSSGIGASGNQKAAKPNDKKPKSTATTGAKKATRTKRTKSTDSIRGYFTGPSQNTDSLDGFFDSNDGLEAEMLAAADMLELNTVREESAPELDADIAAAFADDDDADFEALVNLGGNRNPAVAGPAADLDNSLTQWVRSAYEAEEQPMLWGRQARIAAEPQPAAKRPRLIDDNATTSTPSSDLVRCSGCHQPARLQTARRDGPNQGRSFYKCPKPKECKFFQWADDQAPSTAPTNNSISWGTSNSQENNTATWGSRGASKSQEIDSWGTRGSTEQESDSWGSGNHSSTWGNKATSNSENNISWGSGNNSTARSTSGAVHKSASASQDANAWGSKKSTTTSTWGSKQPANPPSKPNSNTLMRSNSSSTVTITQPAKPGDVKCNCGISASSLIVRKDGPNQGRPFYACPTREKSCGFFQWGDVDANQAGSSNTTSGSGGATKSSWGSGKQQNGAGNTEASGSRQARRCGLCRGEGHTRNKCPRKAEFDF